MDINDTVFKLWMLGDLTRVEEILAEEIAHPFHRARALAQRALVRARLKQWDMAIDDAQEVILGRLLSYPVLTVTYQVYQGSGICHWSYRKRNGPCRQWGARIGAACI